MKYEYITTGEMDKALSAEAKNQKITAKELFNIIVTADMGTLTRNNESTLKDSVFAVYKANPAISVPVDAAILSATPVKVEPVPIEPLVAK